MKPPLQFSTKAAEVSKARVKKYSINAASGTFIAKMLFMGIQAFNFVFWQGSKRFSSLLSAGMVILTLISRPVHALGSASNRDIGPFEKSARLEHALTIARGIVQDALSNQEFIRINRPSAVAGGPSDIRVVLQRFLGDVPVGIVPSQFKVVGNNYRFACPAKSKVPAAEVHSSLNGRKVSASEIYLCSNAFSESDENIAEMLIHEYVHSIGFSRDALGKLSECIATEVELAAMIAAHRSAYGNGFTSGDATGNLCAEMTQSMAFLARDLWSGGEHPNSILPGTIVTFSPSFGADLNRHLLISNVYLPENTPGKQMLEIDSQSGQKVLPKGPIRVSVNNSKLDRIDLVLKDADGVEFELSAMGLSQIPMPLSDLRRVGITFTQD